MQRLKFAPEGLGAGRREPCWRRPTRVVATIRFDGREAATCDAAFGRARCGCHAQRVEPYPQRRSERWGEGETSLAEVHLALSRLAALDEPWPAAQRLFLTDELLKAGVEPETVLKALDR